MLSNNLRKLRKSLNLSQEEFAKELGVTQRAVSAWENGSSEPSLENFFQITQKWDVTPNMLILGEDDPVDYSFYIAKKKAKEFGKINELQELLDDFVIETQLSQILKKIRTLKGKDFFERLIEACNGKGGRALIVLYHFLEHLEKDANIQSTNNAKEILLEELKKFRIPVKARIKHLLAITEKDRKNLIKWVEENFDNIDASAILIDLPKLKEEIKKEINQSTFKNNII